MHTTHVCMTHVPQGMHVVCIPHKMLMGDHAQYEFKFPIVVGDR